MQIKQSIVKPVRFSYSKEDRVINLVLGQEREPVPVNLYEAIELELNLLRAISKARVCA